MRTVLTLERLAIDEWRVTTSRVDSHGESVPVGELSAPLGIALDAIPEVLLTLALMDELAAKG